ncbi:cytochrome o ubiquinol oxidase subunit IV [Methylobacterium sp. E-041]|jgi:cytochrome o ubiquinol oxidase operon protein cyoD|uniref:cytochrome o ubiquinol oxidase subunit IV n=1 Tax=unclassified Methylobacterium TaxID=2615210 RepID=UPI0011CB7A02|nr:MULTISPECIES: cytochrome o ubiquinol oxidase subunit IV [unclassified Methylobacterium]MCJ2041139.1 cytochrome o ubiquinol oxidase subunit IV [Methylobacterium sp. J-059]MCJ2078691.1 cytochrome o ubiquinol oxidase subunit IV [Methylobacterium sp. E-016]MCJ2104191.1 cytochrome o ubiquinol oxidase subunit IV [Methylobacterium sp. E-041]TXN71507.1 cytochrome o ubiquinol oxidase subunit IV [Methylobacterium sp. WL6]
MSSATGAGHHAEPHGHGHDAHGHPAGAHGSFKSYMTGFVLSVILTAIPFWLVMSDVLGNAVHTSLIIMAFAVVQIVVHMIYFLHMNTKSEGGWTILALIFTLTLVVITLTGSIWVMYHLNTNMMPTSPHDLMHHKP